MVEGNTLFVNIGKGKLLGREEETDEEGDIWMIYDDADSIMNEKECFVAPVRQYCVPLDDENEMDN